MIKTVTFFVGLLTAAAALGIFAQDISSFAFEWMGGFSEMAYLTLFTMMSIGLFLFLPLLTVWLGKDRKKHLVLYAVPSYLVGLPVSFWSFFVLAMSGG